MATVPQTPEEIAALRALIAEARSSYHSLMTGTMARVVVDQDGQRVEFTATNAARLYQYIGQLEALLPVDAGFCRPNVGPASFVF